MSSSSKTPNLKRSPPGQGTSRSARRRRAAHTKAAKQQNVSDVFSRPVTQNVNSGNNANSFARAYAKVVDNPFLNAPVRLGFGTLVPTILGVARVTVSITANADGSLLLMAKPNAQNPLASSSAALAAAPAWSNVSDGSWTSAQAQFSTARPIALGIKVTPISSANDKCSRAVGSVYAYESSDNLTLLAGLDGFTCSSWYGSHLGSKEILSSGGSASAMIAWRPMSLENFNFRQDWFADTSALLTTPRISPMIGPIGVIAIVGPASMVYDVEVIYYYEALPQVATVAPGSVDGGPSASDYFPSLEKFYKAASLILAKENVLRIAQLAEFSSNAWRAYSMHPKITPMLVQPRLRVNEFDDDRHDEDVESDRSRSSSVLLASRIPNLRRT